MRDCLYLVERVLCNSHPVPVIKVSDKSKEPFKKPQVFAIYNIKSQFKFCRGIICPCHTSFSQMV